MNKKYLAICGIVVVLVLAIGVVAYENGIKSTTDQPKLYVVATSTDISDIVKEVGGDKVYVESIIPPGQCPGHFDIKPQTLETLKNAQLFLRHDYDSQKFSDELVKSSGNNNVSSVTVGANNATFMVPQMRLMGIDNVTTALVQADPENADYYKKRAETLKTETNNTAVEQKKRLSDNGVNKTKVIVALYQSGFAKWAGFEVVATYPPDISLEEIKNLVEKGRQQGAQLVIDNLQSPDSSAANSISSELGIPVVTLSNYPGGISGTDTWANSFSKNVDLILEQLKKK